MNTNVTTLRPAPTTRDAAHEALRDWHALGGLLMEAAQHPGALTDGDREVLAYRLAQLTKAVRRIL